MASAMPQDDDEVAHYNERKSQELVIYEWQEELDEYDEPDIYPSEKDYKWFEETVTDSEDEEEKQSEKKLTEPLSDSGGPVESKAPEDGETTTAEGDKDADGQPKDAETDKSEKAAEGDEAGEEEEEFVQTIGLESEDQQEEEVTQKKKYKTIKVKKLVPRPPKIYHLPNNIRVEEVTNAPDDFLTPPMAFLHSFGYDCQRLGNLIVLDNTTLLFMSGFVLTFYNHKTDEKTYMRTLGGGSFGSIALHPSRQLFAAAEKGVRPLIGIWSWPKLQLFRLLEEGTERGYASVNFSPNGQLLASQGGEPDYLITVWNWLIQTPILRVKSHVQDVFRVTFAKELAGLLTTSGLCHIKFWKMAGTFTGLKLKGDIGRFGKSEISDIEGYVEMPDGKVLSGTEWGNLLVWESGLVIAELCMANSTPCHSGIVRQILMVEGDFFTTGQDGRVKVWRYEDVDTAEIHTTMESLKVPIKAVTNVTINDEGDIWSIFQDPYNNDDVSVFWFAQDGTGLIWLVDLSFLNIAKEPKVVLNAHGGPIMDCAMSPFGHMMATTGGHGKVIIHSYISRQILAVRRFSGSGTCILWPHHDNFDGFMLIVGFDDGVVRVITLSGKQTSDQFQLSIALRCAHKPHRGRITSMELDCDGEYLVTGGVDGTIFLFNTCDDFTPLCYIEIPSMTEVHKVFWSTCAAGQKIVIAICRGSFIQEIEVPKMEEIDNTTSYCFKNAKYLRKCYVKSIKSVLRRNEELEKKRTEEEEKQAAIERENQRLIDENLETQDEQDARLLEEALELEKTRATGSKKEKPWRPHIPMIPNNILAAFQDHLDPDVIHLTLDEYDSGYIYSVRLMSEDAKRMMGKEAEEPFNAIPIVDCDDVPISRLIFINDGSKIMVGFKNGRIRVSPLSYPYDLETTTKHWTIGVHDTSRGDITSITVNKSETVVMTTGMDGNCFMFSLCDQDTLQHFMAKASVTESPVYTEANDVLDILSPDAYTLEDSKNVEKERAILAAALKSKTIKREKLAHLRFRFADILTRNNELPSEIRLTPVELNIASDTASRCQEQYDNALASLKEEMAWHCEHARIGLEKLKKFYIDRLECQHFVIKAFNSSNTVSSYRLSKHPDFFEDAKLKSAMEHESKHSYFEHFEEERHDQTQEISYEEPRPKRKRGMDKFVHQKMVRLWERRQSRVRRRQQWEEFLKTDPSGKEMESENVLINDARLQIGDMKLKIDPNYKVPESRRLTVKSARKNLIVLEELMFKYQKEFDNDLIALRNFKVRVLKRLQEYSDKLRDCQLDLVESKRVFIAPVPTMTIEEDPNALLTYTRSDILQFQKKLLATMHTVSMTGPAKKVEPKRRRRSISNKLEGEEEKRSDEVEQIKPIPTAFELTLQHIKSVQAEFYQKHYTECIEKEKFVFDAKVKMMKHRKVKLDYDLKIAESRMINLTQEFILAQKSVSMEANLEQIVKECTKEKRVCTTNMKSLQKGIDTHKAQMDSIGVKRGALLKEVIEIATNAPLYEKYLVRVFRKKVRAAKQKHPDDEDDGSDDSDDSDDSEDMAMDEDEDDEDELDVDLPPQDLKPWIYEAVVEVRGRRLALDEAEIKIKTTMDELLSQVNGFKQRMNVAENTLAKTKQELDKFNLEKQFKLNSNEGEVSLHMHQLHYMNANLDEALVINKKDIKRLIDRIPELKREKRNEKRRVQTTKNAYYRMHHEDKSFKERLEEYDNQCDTEMLLKFGRVKPVEELENFCEDPEISKLKRELEDMKKRHDETMRVLEAEMESIQRDHNKVTSKQNERIHECMELNIDLARITASMDAGLSILPSKLDDSSGPQELKHLREVIMHQKSILDYLKFQVMTLTNQAIMPLPPIKPPE